MHLCLAVRCQITCKNWHNLIIWRTCSDTNCHRNCQFAWHGLQLLCISLCRNLLKTMNCPAADHAEILILAGRVSNFYALAYAAACLQICLSDCRRHRNINISWDGLQLLCISFCRGLLKSMSFPIAGHVESLIPVVTVCNFYALAYAAACLKLCPSWCDFLHIVCILSYGIIHLITGSP